MVHSGRGTTGKREGATRPAVLGVRPSASHVPRQTAATSEPEPTAVGGLSSERPRSVQLSKLSALLLLAAGGSFALPAFLPDRHATLLLLMAGCALSLAGLVLLLPAARSAVRLSPAQGTALLALGGAAYALAQLHVADPLSGSLLVVGVIAGALINPTELSTPFWSLLSVLFGYAAGSEWSVPASLAAPAIAAGALLTYGATRAQGAQHERRLQAAAVEQEVERLTGEIAAIKGPSEVAAVVAAAATKFAAALDPAEIVGAIAKTTTVQIRTAATALLLWDEAQETLRIGALDGRYESDQVDIRQVEVLPDTVPTLRDDTPGRVVSIDPAAFREPLLQSLLRRWKIKTMLGVRLQRADRLLGLLYTFRTEEQPRFSARDVEVLSGLALHATAALAHANLISDLQSANQLKEEFMATMSHELRTPLNVIIGYTDLQLDGCFGDLAEDHVDAIRRTREQALQLLELIQATLDMSRLERGMVTVDLRDVSMPEFVEHLEDQIPSAWRKSTVQLNWRSAPKLPPLRTDASKLQILLRNLIHNALKFTHHGMVTVSVSAHPIKEQITFLVQDSGVGIKAEHLSSIFEMFRQIPQPDSVPGGVGLGLYIVKRLAIVLGAEIEVTSAPGRGTTFRIHLPVGGPLAARK